MADVFIPKKIWHFAVLYPTLFIALAGSIPTGINAAKAWYLDTNVSRVQIVEDQRKLWEANIECLAESPAYSTTVSKSITIGVTLCPSGDALLRYKVTTEAGESVSYSWVRYPGQDTAKERQARVKATLGGEREVDVQYGAGKCVALQPSAVIRILYNETGCAVEAIALNDARVFAARPIDCHTLCARVQVVQH
jgi:hypothetical protein